MQRIGSHEPLTRSDLSSSSAVTGDLKSADSRKFEKVSAVAGAIFYEVEVRRNYLVIPQAHPKLTSIDVGTRFVRVYPSINSHKYADYSYIPEHTWTSAAAKSMVLVEIDNKGNLKFDDSPPSTGCIHQYQFSPRIPNDGYWMELSDYEGVLLSAYQQGIIIERI